jgi:hypothetical protein
MQRLHDAMQEWMAKFNLLKELQTLVINHAATQPLTTLEWERFQCELLHSGSPDLALVSLHTGVVWKRHSNNWVILENETAAYIEDYVVRRMRREYGW